MMLSHLKPNLTSKLLTPSFLDSLNNSVAKTQANMTSKEINFWVDFQLLQLARSTQVENESFYSQNYLKLIISEFYVKNKKKISLKKKRL